MLSDIPSANRRGLARAPMRDAVSSAPDDRSLVSASAFGLLAVLYLATFGPFNSALAALQVGWHITVLLLSLGLLVAVRVKTHAPRAGCGVNTLLSIAALALGILLIVVAVMHGAALGREPGYQSVNVAEVSVVTWLGQNLKFTVLYVFFPILLLLQVLLLREVSATTVIRAIAILSLATVSVQFVQALVVPTFLNAWPIWTKRYGGLATDPNAYAMSALLAAPLLIAGTVLEKRVLWRSLLVLAAALLVGGLVWAGNRTAVGAIAILVALSPAIIAVARTDLSRGLRLLLLVSPVVLIAAGLALIHYNIEAIAASGLLGKRIAQSWEKVLQGGLAELLFKGEARGALWMLGWALLLRAPLGGWGPGGFYREYPNELFFETAQIRPAFDSVLNHYLMVPIDFGVPALLLYLVLMLAPLAIGVLSLRRLQATGPRLLVVTLLATQSVLLLAITTIPPAYFPDVVWLWTLQLGLLLVIGEGAGVSLGSWLHARRTRTVAAGAAGLLVLVSAVGAYHVTFGKQGYRARLDAEGSPLRYERNCYGIEQQGEVRWRWCGRNARVKLPIGDKALDEIVVRLSAGNPDLGQNPLVVRYGGLTGPRHELVLGESPSAEIRLQLAAGDVVEVPRADGGATERFAVLSVDPSRTWVPKEWDFNEDTRELGVLVELPAVQQ